MNDFEKVEQVFDMLEEADVMHVFDDTVWIAVDREAWEEYTGVKFETEDEDGGGNT